MNSGSNCQFSIVNRQLVKVCGMTEDNNIRAVEQLHPDMMGFIFYPQSPRYCRQKPAYLPELAKRVGVFVDTTEEEIQNRWFDFKLDYVQLHGNESPAFCQSLKEKGICVIKAFQVSSADDLTGVEVYEGLCDYFLFDTKSSQKGGSGKQFNWQLLLQYQGHTPFLLSGGIGLESVCQLQTFTHPMLAGYDLNSRFETSPGIKNIALLKEFMKTTFSHQKKLL